MSSYLGLDTSNYTTSACVYKDGIFYQKKKLLPVKDGEKGLRQSDAVFHHTAALSKIITDLFSTADFGTPDAVGVSVSPTRREGSYMPCFLVGINVAESLSGVMNIPLYTFSHQEGHIAAVLAGAERTELLSERFIAFHLSGGTTEAVLVQPDKDNIFVTSLIARSLDLKAGQAIDRAGVMLGLKFPCGAELDRLSLNSDREFAVKPSVKGADCSFSGIENKCIQMKNAGESDADIARFCIMSVVSGIDFMAEALIKEYGNLPLVFSGGVSSNTLLRNHFIQKYNAVFAEPSFSADNAAGISYLTYLKNNEG
ncbi:MAG: peptidase M22 [Ruminococcaceae bacterium]|nr:peptidase M22 [Oscillospiraceae bacterium]